MVNETTYEGYERQLLTPSDNPQVVTFPALPTDEGPIYVAYCAISEKIDDDEWRLVAYDAVDREINSRDQLSVILQTPPV